MARITLNTWEEVVKLAEVKALAEKLAKKHGLSVNTPGGWTVVFDRSKHRAGQCRYGKLELGFSAYLFAVWEWDHITNTILHEIAHALCPGHHHDKVWRNTFIMIGGSGKRCWGDQGEIKVAAAPFTTAPDHDEGVTPYLIVVMSGA